MKWNALCLLVALFTCISLSSSCNKTDTVCDANDANCTSIETFADELNRNLRRYTKGYSFSIFYDGVLQQTGSHGLTRYDGQGEQITAFTTRMNIASSSKTISSIAVLQLLDAHGYTLDTRIIDFLPQWWTFGPNTEVITFRDLLLHESGFVVNAETYQEMKAQLAQGIDLSNHGIDAYRNFNFCLLRLLIPALNGDVFYNSEFELPWSDSNYDAMTRIKYMEYIKKEVFLGSAVDCTNSDNVLYYNHCDHSDPGFDPGYQCDRAGGGTLAVTTNLLGMTMYRAKYTNLLLSKDMRDALFDPTMAIGLGLYTTHSPAPTVAPVFHHNGGITGARSCWYIFHNDIVVAVAVNSEFGINNDFDDCSTSPFNDINHLIEASFTASFI